MRLAQFAAALERREYAPRTVSMYVQAIRRLEAWLTHMGHPPLSRCRPESLRAFADTLPYTYASRGRFRHALAAYWTAAGRSGPVPLWAIPSPKQPPLESRALPEGAGRLVVAAALQVSPAAHAACALMYFAALRRDETRLMTWRCFGEDGYLRLIGKGAKPARLPMHPDLIRALGCLERRDPEWVFPGRRIGRPVADATLNLWVRLAGAAAGLGHVTPHQLRHTALTDANDLSGDLRTVQEFARHANPRTTAGYTRVRARKLREVVDAL